MFCTLATRRTPFDVFQYLLDIHLLAVLGMPKCSLERAVGCACERKVWQPLKTAASVVRRWLDVRK